MDGNFRLEKAFVDINVGRVGVCHMHCPIPAIFNRIKFVVAVSKSLLYHFVQQYDSVLCYHTEL